MSAREPWLDAALGQLDREDRLLDVLRQLVNHIKSRDAELAELRDELLALSNRIEAVSRAAQREPVRPLIQSVPRPRPS